MIKNALLIGIASKATLSDNYLVWWLRWIHKMIIFLCTLKNMPWSEKAYPLYFLKLKVQANLSEGMSHNELFIIQIKCLIWWLMNLKEIVFTFINTKNGLFNITAREFLIYQFSTSDICRFCHQKLE